MNFETFSKILDKLQRETARQGITKAERAKKELTHKEKLQRYTQAGMKLRYKDIWFTYDGGLGLLKYADGHKMWGACLDDFAKEVYKTYGKKYDWAN